MRHDVVHDDVSGSSVARAVSARSHDLSVVAGVEVLDVDRAAAVELDDFVRGLPGAAADDVRGSGGLLEGYGVFADVLEEDVDEGARSTQRLVRLFFCSTTKIR